MRPLRLEMEALGPFPDQVVLDFRNLADQSIFLIHGPTGAGKTTILDAICFALYGETSGQARDPRQMRSHHAKESNPTRVRFDFSVGRELYRLIRNPGYLRPKKRGTGLVEEKPGAVLWKRTGLTDDREEGTVVADQVGSVGEAVQARLGFQVDQFRQVIMLPQGRFRRLLLADSKDRQAILETLFRTELYRRVEEWLKKAAAETETGIRDLERARKTILEQAAGDSADHLRSQQKELQARIQAMDLDGRRKEEQEAQARLQKAGEDIQKLQEKDKADQAWQALAAQRPEHKLKKIRLARARKAAPVAALEDGRRQRQKEEQEAEKRARTAEGRVAQAKEHAQKAEQFLADHQAREPQREEAARKISRLEDLAPKTKALEQLKSEISAIEQQWTRAQAEHQKIQKLGINLDRRFEQLDQELLKTRDLAGRLEAFGLADERSRERLAQRQKLVEALDQKSKAKDAHQAALKKTAQAEKKCLQTRNELSDLESAWRLGQSAILARTLAPGQPCPVCGALDHPAPAASETPLPEDKDLEQRKEDLSRLERALDQHRRAEFLKEQDVNTWVDRIGLLKEHLGELADRDLKSLEEEAALRGRDLVQAQKARTRLEHLDQERGRLSKETEQQKKGLEEASESIRTLAGILDQKKAVLEDRLAEIPMEWRSAKDLDQALAAEQRTLKALKKALEDAGKSRGEAQEGLVKAQTALDEARSGEIQAMERRRAEEKAFKEAIQTAGFDTEPDYLEARMPSDRISELEKVIERFESEQNRADERRERALKAASGLEPPDIEAVQTRARAAREALEAAIQEQARIKARVDQLGRWIESLKAIEHGLEEKEKEYALVGRLAQVASGDNPQRITFQRFVLSALLDEVLISATQRLKIMSGGRYELQRAREVGDRRKAAGLDLEVFDHYTGQSRPAGTLSGGEGFLAALSLALGLADAVQAHSGGIHLETIFVDEGFGSLDPEALDLALRALFDLRRGGRLVGLISHVPELKERIPARLEVTPTRSGSTARFVV